MPETETSTPEQEVFACSVRHKTTGGSGRFSGRDVFELPPLANRRAELAVRSNIWSGARLEITPTTLNVHWWFSGGQTVSYGLVVHASAQPIESDHFIDVDAAHDPTKEHDFGAWRFRSIHSPDSHVRIATATDELQEAFAPIATDLVACVLEMATGAVFIFSADEKLVTANAAARELMAHRDFAVSAVARSAHHEVIEEPTGPLRVTRRELRADGALHVVVMLAEPFVTNASEVVRLATSRWRLTTRQADILRGVLDGLSNKEIASELGVSHRTVEVHVSALLAKAGVDSRGRLVARAREALGKVAR